MAAMAGNHGGWIDKRQASFRNLTERLGVRVSLFVPLPLLHLSRAVISGTPRDVATQSARKDIEKTGALQKLRHSGRPAYSRQHFAARMSFFAFLRIIKSFAQSGKSSNSPFMALEPRSLSGKVKASNLNTYPVWCMEDIATSPDLSENIRNGSVIPLRAIITHHGGPRMNSHFNLYYLHWWTLTYFILERPEHHARSLALVQSGGGLKVFEQIIGPIEKVQPEWHAYVRRLKSTLSASGLNFQESSAQLPEDIKS